MIKLILLLKKEEKSKQAITFHPAYGFSESQILGNENDFESTLKHMLDQQYSLNYRVV